MIANKVLFIIKGRIRLCTYGTQICLLLQFIAEEQDFFKRVFRIKVLGDGYALMVLNAFFNPVH